MWATSGMRPPWFTMPWVPCFAALGKKAVLRRNIKTVLGTLRALAQKSGNHLVHVRGEEIDVDAILSAKFSIWKMHNGPNIPSQPQVAGLLPRVSQIHRSQHKQRLGREPWFGSLIPFACHCHRPDCHGLPRLGSSTPR